MLSPAKNSVDPDQLAFKNMVISTYLLEDLKTVGSADFEKPAGLHFTVLQNSIYLGLAWYRVNFDNDNANFRNAYQHRSGLFILASKIFHIFCLKIFLYAQMNPLIDLSLDYLS